MSRWNDEQRVSNLRWWIGDHLGWIVGIVLAGMTVAAITFVVISPGPSLEEYCTYSNTADIRIIHWWQNCMPIVQQSIDEGWQVQRYGVAGHDLIILEK